MNSQSKGHVVVTGGAGYIGSLLVGALLEAGYRVTALDKLLFGGQSLEAYRGNPDFHFVEADVTEAGVIEEAVHRDWPAPAALIHLAALVGFPACAAAGRAETWRQNVEATRHVYQSAAALGAERLIFASTYSNYGRSPDGQPVAEDAPLHPQSLYAESKIAAEEYLLAQAGGPRPVIFRFATLFGLSPRTRFDLIINQFVLDAYTERHLLLYQADFQRSFIHIRDVVRGLLLALQAPLDVVGGQIFNLGDEAGNLSKRQLAALIQRRLPDLEIETRDLEFDGDMRDITANFDKARRLLGFQAQITIEAGIAEVLDALEGEMIPHPHDGRYRNAPALVP